ncbi:MULTISPECIES: peptidoglycan D,D-transpeptidase FtsI family protein [Aeribacillus]|jgi:penicillin-binding protein 4B|uniref:serine-type D-Ala-D-Ala carboxypeptidase n=2 Tax=Aeribacillus TaxID=1055323 RepID=A0A165XP05_9BACI|nr:MULTISPECIES: penicillin-binding protein 2 [Aeribacillus]KZN96241.1 penicillin-binding protein [Aeribacillus pallidus]MED0702098.1 penicillin-binding protein 2 [Aeribacillus composti]WNF32211.1 penicillin-binding protein 2 [Aeribacillus composti]
MNKRIKYIGVFIILLMGVLIYRLAQIQLLETESFSEQDVNLMKESVKQRTQEVIIDDGRGRFIDRENKPLNETYLPTLVLFPFLKNYQWPIDQLAAAISVRKDEIEQLLKGTKNEPILLNKEKGFQLDEQDIKAINKLKIPGVFGIFMKTEQSDNIASHLIGMTSENETEWKKRYPDKEITSLSPEVGVTGLEEAFDEFLQPEDASRLLYHVDGLGRPLFGVNVKYIADSNPFYPIAVQTTIDKHLQEKAEQILTKHQINEGGLVLLDIENSEVVAMASKPDLDRNDPKTYENKMLSAMFPGSVFKTVIAAAAIDTNMIKPERTFNCDRNVYGQTEKEEEKRAGTLTFEESFAKSCNYAFATIGQELIQKKSNIIEEYAEKLGLLSFSGWSGKVYHYDQFKQFPREQRGTIWGDDSDKRSAKAIAQTSIGQKNVKVTPLAVANMMATIARGGEKREVKVVDKILYKNGETMYTFKNHLMKGEKISPATSSKLTDLLLQVVAHPDGTGRAFQSLPVKVAGKSGTAETGTLNDNGKKLYHKWFAGFFPAEHPKYALVVVDMNKTSGRAKTNDVFYEMVEQIYNVNEE